MKGARCFIAVSLGQLVKFIIGDTNTRLADEVPCVLLRCDLPLMILRLRLKLLTGAAAGFALGIWNRTSFTRSIISTTGIPRKKIATVSGSTVRDPRFRLGSHEMNWDCWNGNLIS